MDIVTFILALAFTKKQIHLWTTNSDGFSIGIEGNTLIVTGTSSEENDG